MKHIVLATGNPGKIKEMSQILSDLGIRFVTASDVLGYQPDIQETGNTFEQNARIKAEAIARLTGMPAIADDSGLEVDALDGRPGVYSARWAGEGVSSDNLIMKLLDELNDVPHNLRSARYRCTTCFADLKMNSILTAKGVCEGSIAHEPRGVNGFGYDPIFWLPDVSKTMAELSAQEKNVRSHRSIALKALISILQYRN